MTELIRRKPPTISCNYMCRPDLVIKSKLMSTADINYYAQMLRHDR